MSSDIPVSSNDQEVKRLLSVATRSSEQLQDGRPAGGRPGAHEAHAAQRTHTPGAVDDLASGPTPDQPTVVERDAEDEAVEDHGAPGAEAHLPPPVFKPFFTLIENVQEGLYHHPNVLYQFIDDDADAVTSAALDSLDMCEDGGLAAGEPEERFIVLDMAADGKAVASTTSLCPYWQNVKTEFMPAPSWNDATTAERGLMLRVSGQECALVTASSKQTKARKHTQDIDEVAEHFGRQLHSLEEIIAHTPPLLLEQETASRSQ